MLSLMRALIVIGKDGALMNAFGLKVRVHYLI
jgi:hypothetical protein